MKMLKKLLLGLSSLSIIGATMPADAASPKDNATKLHAKSPLVNSPSKAQVQQLVRALQAAGGGSVNDSNVRSSIRAVLAQNPGISLNAMTAATNQLDLQGSALAGAVEALSRGYNVSSADVSKSMITEAYLNEGKGGASDLAAELRVTVGSEAVNNAFESSSSDIQALNDTASNNEFFTSDSGSSLYNG